MFRCIARLLVLVGVCGVASADGQAEGRQAAPAVAPVAATDFLNSLSEAERAWLRAHPVIRVAQDPSWPPIEFADAGGAPSGMSADYLTLIESRLGFKFERVKGLSWQEAYERMKRWEIDMTTTVAVTPERETFWTFTKPYMTIPIVIVTRSDVTYIAELRELEGRKVAVVDGYVANTFITRDFPGIELVRVQTTAEALRLLQRGEVFACVENMLVVGHYLAQLKISNLKIAGSTPYTHAQGMAVRKDWAPLAGILDRALDSISQEERNTIYRRWLPVSFEYGLDYTRLLPVAALVAVFLLGLAAWRWKQADEDPGLVPGGGQLKGWQAYLFAISATAATFGLRLSLDGQLGGQPTLVIFTLPIMLSAYLGGLRAGLLATAATLFGASYFLLAPIYSFAVDSSTDRWQLFLVALAGFFISGLSELLHRARAQAESAIREQRRAEESNVRALRRLTEAQRIGKIGDWEFDLGTGAITWSPQTFEILGRDPRLGPPGNYEENAAQYEPAGAARMAEKVAAVIASGEAQEYELVAVRPDGQRVPVQAMAVPRKDATGKVVGLYGTVQDVSARKQAEHAALLLAAIVESSDDAIVGRDLSGLVTSWNAGAERLFGYAAAEMIGQPLHRIVPPERHAEEANFLAQITRGETVRSVETVRLHKDGRTIDISITVSAIKDPAGTIVGASMTARDITERKRAEESMALERQKLAAVIENTHIGFVVCDPQGGRMSMNPAALRFHGFASMAEINYTEMSDYAEKWELQYLDGRRMPLPEWPVSRAINGDFVRDYEARLRNVQTGCEWIGSYTSTAMRNSAGAVMFLVFTVLDITERKQAEQDRQKFVVLAESSSEFIGMCDLDFNPTYLNPAGMRMVGLPDMNAACQVKVQDYFFQDDQPFVTEEFFPRVLSEGHGEVEIRLRHFQTGEPIWMSYSLFQMHGERGAVVGWAAVSRDITERRESEAKIRQLNAELEQRVLERTAQLEIANRDLKAFSTGVERDLRVAEAADRIKSAFLATMSHELRTPLNSIIGFTGIVLMGKVGPLNGEQAKQLGMVRESAWHLLSLINDVLDISKIEAGQLKVSSAPFDLPASITRVMSMISPLAQNKSLLLTAEIAPQLGEMLSDQRRVEQILINLLTNAVKFTAHGRVTLTAELLADFRPSSIAPPQPSVCLRVTDTGIGIRPEDLALLFQPFHQLDTGPARQVEGTGLGLAICRRLASLLGGEIAAASTWSQGSEFTVILPLQRPTES